MQVRSGPWLGRFFIAVFAASLALGFLACGGSQEPQAETAAPAPVANLEQEQALIDAHLALIGAFENRDVDAFLGLLDPSSQTLIFHPLLENRFDGSDRVREAVPRMFANLSDVSWTDVHPTVMIQGDVAWMTSELLVTSSHMSDPFIGRGTEVWILRDNGWRLIHAHWSKHAKLAG